MNPLKAGACPICGKPADPLFAPFCCKRCKDIDLHRWLGEVYTIPVVETNDLLDDEALPAPDADRPRRR